MSDDLRIPIVKEEATVIKRSVETERVSVRTSTEEEQVLVRDAVRREHVEITRVPKDEEVSKTPDIRTEGDLTIIPVLEERLVIEKRLFLVEELHLRRTVDHEPVELPTTLRRTRVDVEREDLEQKEQK
ncbi:YsnF/AvaK domain-containing protein [Sphingomonas xinjiangensis]|uniref:Stress response protein YsnF n=1 Tax=Sphingomonas xinjiangensis TaxID=643568 RepID=A0A840YTS7_9SPHN|nr:YsnF/AvaK domain-containing protein [Sphingomonas xinjiangensis]MBB5713037.1 stress response protein YsnF [Sphingomonas xinjiangensis]